MRPVTFMGVAELPVDLALLLTLQWIGQCPGRQSRKEFPKLAHLTEKPRGLATAENLRPGKLILGEDGSNRTIDDDLVSESPMRSRVHSPAEPRVWPMLGKWSTLEPGTRVICQVLSLMVGAERRATVHEPRNLIRAVDANSHT